jgi:hypothetical protein
LSDVCNQTFNFYFKLSSKLTTMKSTVVILFAFCLATSAAIDICTYCDGTCSGSSVCTSYPENTCVQVNSGCTGELIGWGIFTTGSEDSANLYGSSDCSGEASLSFTATCGTCIPEMASYAACNPASIVAPTFAIGVVALLAVSFF